MQKNNRYKKIAFWVVVAVFISGCSIPFLSSNSKELEGTQDSLPADEEGSETTETGISSIETDRLPSPTPFVYNGPMPSTGSGGVYGRLLWNGQPVEGIEVKLCDEIKLIGGCTGAEYFGLSDSDGVYAIINIPPGSYGLTFRAVDSDTWYFIQSGFLDAKDFEIIADVMVDVGDFHTVRTDLVILTPMDDERLESVSRPVISWEAYPNAAYYELTFHASRGGSLIHGMELTETSFTMDRDLQNCEYSFSINAYNAQGIMIAENDGWQYFRIAGLPQSCKLIPLTPADGATVSANAITLSWEPHDWADVYKLHMYVKSDSSTKILNFVETRETSYTITQDVPAGEYAWVVYAYDEFGDGIGFSDVFDLNVTNP